MIMQSCFFRGFLCCCKPVFLGQCFPRATNYLHILDRLVPPICFIILYFPGLFLTLSLCVGYPSIPNFTFFRPLSLNTALASSLFSTYLKNLYIGVDLMV